MCLASINTIQDDMQKLVTILTPTYNRRFTLTRLYDSLKNQTDKDFIWMIVDDGSSDDTIAFIKNIQKDSILEIVLIEKQNGGKHTALNIGIKQIITELTFIVDSDDYLTPDAVNSIKNEWSKVNELGLCGIGFLRGYDIYTPIIETYPINNKISDYNTITKNMGVKGDKAEVWVTKILKDMPFPEYEHEVFFAEGYVWSSIAFKYNMYFVNKIIYITEYLENGLTKSGRKLRISCPLGGMKNASILLSKQFIIKIRAKNALLYVCYGFFAGYSPKKILNLSEHKFLIFIALPFGYLLYQFWKYKYL